VHFADLVRSEDVAELSLCFRFLRCTLEYWPIKNRCSFFETRLSHLARGTSGLEKPTKSLLAILGVTKEAEATLHDCRSAAKFDPF
jgi:hypothetical protein